MPAAEHDRQPDQEAGRAGVDRDDGGPDAGIQHRDVTEGQHDVEQCEPDCHGSDSIEHGRVQAGPQIGVDHRPDCMVIIHPEPRWANRGNLLFASS
jgi:hypothetical protein